MPGQPGLLGPETPQDISFQSMIGLPEEVLSTTFSFLKDALESQEERDMSAGLARGVGTAPSQYARCLVALRAAGTLGATLDSLLRQWARFFQDYWTLAGEREVLALLVRSTVSNTEPAGRSDSGNKSKQASRSTAKGKAKTAPKDCVMALALLDAALQQIQDKQKHVAFQIKKALTDLEALRGECSSLIMLVNSVIHEMRRVRGVSLNLELFQRTFLCQVLQELANRCQGILGITAGQWGAADAHTATYRRHRQTITDKVTEIYHDLRLPGQIHASSPDAAFKEPAPRSNRSTTESSERSSGKRKRDRRSTSSSQSKSPRTDPSNIASSLAAKAMESPGITKLLDGIAHVTSSQPSIPPPGQGAPFNSSQGSIEPPMPPAPVPPAPIPPPNLSEDSETDEEREGGGRPRRRIIVSALASHHAVQTPVRPPPPPQTAAGGAADSSQDNGGGASNGSSLSPSVLAIPSASNRPRASGRAPSEPPREVTEDVLEPSPLLPQLPEINIESSEKQSGSDGASKSRDRLSVDMGQGRTVDESGVSIATEDLNALAVMLAAGGSDFSLSSGAQRQADSQQAPASWSASDAASQVQAQAQLGGRSQKRARTEGSSSGASEPEAKRVRFETARQPLSDKSWNDQSGSGSGESSSGHPSVISRLLGWVGISRSSGEQAAPEAGSQTKKSQVSSDDSFHSV